jgi:predicted cupin superfamily sugar epimerase
VETAVILSEAGRCGAAICEVEGPATPLIPASIQPISAPDTYAPPVSLHSMTTSRRACCALLTFLAASLIAQQPTPQEPNPRVRKLIRTLHLSVLPRESGYLGIIGVTPLQVPVDGRQLSVQSQNYYMLTRALPINFLHRLEPADTHILIEGGPVDYYIFHPDGAVERQTLGRDVAHGEHPVIAVPPGCAKALVLRQGAAYALTANALSPEFTPDRVVIGAGKDFIARYEGKAPWATKEFLRKLIGPNAK